MGEPRDDDPVFPDWLVEIEAGAASRQMGKSMSSSFSQSKPKPIGRPLSPQSPGKGGWPGSKARVVDPLWGGTSTSTSVKSSSADLLTASINAASLKRAPSRPLDSGLPLAASPLSSTVVSEPSLARWRAGLKAGSS